MIFSFLCHNSVNSRHQDDGSKDDQKMKTHCKFLQILPESDLLPLLQCAFAKSALVAPADNDNDHCHHSLVYKLASSVDATAISENYR